MIDIQPFDYSQQSYETMAEIYNACWPEYLVEVSEIKRNDKNRQKSLLFERYMVTLKGKPAAVGYLREPRYLKERDRINFNLNVLPEARRQGIATAFYDLVLNRIAANDLQPKLLETETREDQLGALAWLAKMGFERNMRFPRSLLDLETFDPTDFEAAVSRMEAEKIRLASLKDLQDKDDQAIYKFYDLVEHHLMKDVPMPGEYNPNTFEEFQKSFVESKIFTPESVFIALDGDRYVGMSGAFPENRATGLWMTGLTGTLQGYRRRGIALALKVKSIAATKALGAKTIETDNEENNPMYDLNLKLGFQPAPAWLDFVKAY
ncbi:MAG: GNAT family N-acetyltransferase [Ardenticatenaceae bacterium]|nr:GNAT family N-acetyltransferase [Ardenticatenaceae bacterium]